MGGGLTFKVDEVTVSSSVSFSLSDDDAWQCLLSQFWLSLLDGSEEDVSDRTLWQSVQSG